MSGVHSRERMTFVANAHRDTMSPGIFPNEMPFWLPKCSLRGDLRFARAAQFSASVATPTKKISSK